MKLKTARVRLFRNILDSGEVDVQQDVTCLVGKNESGKSAFLEALRRLNPAPSQPKFDVAENYPAWLEKKHRLRGDDLEAVAPITAVFVLDDDDRAAFERLFGEGVLTNGEITASRTYGDDLLFDFEIDRQKAVANLLAGLGLPNGIGTQAKKADTFEALSSFADGLDVEGEGTDESRAARDKIKAAIAGLCGSDLDVDRAVVNFLEARLPSFFHFAEYSRLPAVVKIRQLLQADEASLDDNQLAARSLLTMAAAEKDYLLNTDYERRKRELENVANAITDDVLTYWTTNTELRVHIDITQKTESDPNGQKSVLDELRLRMWDNRHMLSLPFSERSSGFQGFFSFLAAFSRYEYSNDPVIILLDEPGLGLHARAQHDFLRFIDDRLSAKRQVIYSTHSPFMVQPKNWSVRGSSRTRGARPAPW